MAMAGCLTVPPGSDRITAADLLPVMPGIEAAAAGTLVALAPAPGVQRVLHPAELARIAERLHASPPEREVCFERRTMPLDPALVLAAMQKQLPKAAIEIMEISRWPVPEGDLEFPLSGLRESATGGGLWIGSVRYANTRRFSVWAKVNVRVQAERVIAVQDIKAGQLVEAGQLRIEHRDEFPSSRSFAGSVEGLAGRVARQSIRAGSVLRLEWFDTQREVLRGQSVQVDVWSGGAHLELQAEAGASGSTGQTIPVKNPATGKRFPARVEGKGRVSVGKAGL